ncbi:MAG: DUF4123 domain-containing protein [Paracoccus sp. (in: a-proteobacteria)]|nr:DUF4123 domain-containing protein [Paracoccus sp. (in: a-proteobacteria)]
MFSDIAPVVPLDRQFGVASPLAVPDPLRPVLFPEAQKVLAVVDMAKFAQGAQVLDGHDALSRNLFAGEAAQKFEDTAPYLVELDATSPLTRLLLTHDPGLSASMTTRHAYHLEAAIFLHPKADFGTVWAHLRRFNPHS